MMSSSAVVTVVIVIVAVVDLLACAQPLAAADFGAPPFAAESAALDNRSDSSPSPPAFDAAPDPDLVAVIRSPCRPEPSHLFELLRLNRGRLDALPVDDLVRLYDRTVAVAQKPDAVLKSAASLDRNAAALFRQLAWCSRYNVQHGHPMQRGVVRAAPDTLRGLLLRRCDLPADVVAAALPATIPWNGAQEIVVDLLDTYDRLSLLWDADFILALARAGSIRLNLERVLYRVRVPIDALRAVWPLYTSVWRPSTPSQHPVNWPFLERLALLLEPGSRTPPQAVWALIPDLEAHFQAEFAVMAATLTDDRLRLLAAIGFPFLDRLMAASPMVYAVDQGDVRRR